MQDAEIAVTLLYELGEGAPEEAMKPRTGALAQLAQGKATDMSFLAQAKHMSLFRLLLALQWSDPAAVNLSYFLLCSWPRQVIHQSHAKLWS
jgi:hypothetical protein